jgi:hypothetical protein
MVISENDNDYHDCIDDDSINRWIWPDVPVIAVAVDATNYHIPTAAHAILLFQ